MPDDPATILLNADDWIAWQAQRRGPLRALAQRLAIDTRKRFWRILGPDFQVLDEGEVTRGCNP